MAENRFLDKDGLSILVTKIKTELDNVDDVLLFKGIVDDAEVLQGSAASISQISYISSKKVFAGYNKPSYYNNWGTRAKYCNEAGTPIGGKIFIDVDTYKVYTWNGGDLREVLGKDLATINRVLDSLPADILTGISATTDAESMTLSFAAAGKGSKGDYGAANAKEIVLNPATPNDAGLMSAADKKKIDKAATLDEQGKVPSSQLPSFVDDVQEFQGFVENVELTDTPPVVLSVIIGIYYDVSRKVFITKVRNGETEVYTSKMFPSFVDKPTSPTPLSGKIYVDLSTNKTYRWSGSNLVEISASLALGETENTAFAGDRGVALEGEVADLKESVKAKADKDFVGNNLNSISEDISKIKASAIKNIRPSYDATHVNLSQEKIEGAAVNISIDTATSSKAGAMSAADKEKLDNFIDSEETRNRNETARVSAETDRAAAEVARVKAETARADAESKRAAAETKREEDFSAKVEEVDTAVANAKTATSEAEKVDATITEANVFEVTGRDGVKKSLELVGQAEAATIKTELAGKFDKASVVQELGEAEDKVVSQKCTSAIYEKLKNAQYLVDSDDMESFYITDENGYIIAKVDKNGLHAINITDTRITLSEKVSNGIPLYHNGEYVYGGSSDLYRKKVVGVGDSLSQNGLYEKDFCEISGAEYAGVYSIGGRNSIPSITKKSSQDSIKKLLDDNIDVDILLFENINDGWFTGVFQGPQFPGAITDKPFFAEQYVPSSKVYSSYAAAKKAFEREFDTITGSIENKTKGTCFAIRYTSSSYSIKVNSSSKSSGSIILKIGDAKYTTTISASMGAQEIASAIGITNYVFFDKRIDGDTVILTFNGEGELPNVSIDTNDTGAELSIVNQASAESYVNAYFMGYTSSEFASISNWQIGYLTLYSAYKGIIEKLQSERPNLRIVFISPSVWSQSWNESTSTYDASLMNEDGTFNYSKIMEQDYVKRNLKLIEIKKEVSELYNIEHIDIHHICGVSPFNMKGFYNENDVHPKRELYTLWAKIIYNNLK